MVNNLPNVSTSCKGAEPEFKLCQVDARACFLYCSPVAHILYVDVCFNFSWEWVCLGTCVPL